MRRVPSAKSAPRSLTFGYPAGSSRAFSLQNNTGSQHSWSRSAAADTTPAAYHLQNVRFWISSYSLPWPVPAHPPLNELGLAVNPRRSGEAFAE